MGLLKRRTTKRGKSRGLPERKEPLGVEYLPAEDLRPYQNNSRLHPKSQIDKLARSIGEFGFLGAALSHNPILGY